MSAAAQKMPEPTPDQRPVLKELIQKHSIRVVPAEEALKLSSGDTSRVYCDLQKTILRNEASLPLGLCLANLIRETPEFGGFANTAKMAQAFAGVALGGCHLASFAAISPYLNYQGFERHTIFIRKQAKDHGTQSLIEAPDLPAGTRVLLLEDVMTTGRSAAKALAVLMQHGYHVMGIIAIVDRRDAWTFTAPSSILGVPVRSLFRIEELVKHDGS